jgi:glycosyltransferase involved in cell wall biosynthesis
MALYGRPMDDAKYEDAFNRLGKTRNIALHRPVPMPELFRELAVSGVYVHPSTYHETFGMVVAMA